MHRSSLGCQWCNLSDKPMALFFSFLANNDTFSHVLIFFSIPISQKVEASTRKYRKNKEKPWCNEQDDLTIHNNERQILSL